MNIKVTSVSSKGQIVIPSEIREKLGLASGTNMLVLTDGSNLLLKPINAPDMKSFDKLVKDSRALASKKKLTRRAVQSIIKKVRHENRP